MPNQLHETAKAWLKSAWYDLDLAQKAGRDSIERGLLCYHAQQCAEKSIKAVLIFKGIPFKKYHDAAYLCKTLRDNNIIFSYESELATLGAFLLARYPGEIDEIEEIDREKTADLAEIIYTWADAIIK